MVVNGAKRIHIVRERKAAVPIPVTVVRPKAGRKVLVWESKCDLSAAPDSKKFDEVKDSSGNVIDRKNVSITGYLSTFKNVTESDRDGDAVENGAFKETIPAFLKNPVLLIDHRNSAENIAGRFTEVKEDKNGLRVTAMLSDSPTDRMKHIRALVAEGHLKTLSMGGRFHYRDDGRTIFKVELYEGSLVSIPANPDALFSVRECTEAEMKEVQDVAA